MKRIVPLVVVLAAAVGLGWYLVARVESQPAPAGTEKASTGAKNESYDALVALYQKMVESQRPVVVDGVADFTPAAVSARRQKLDELAHELDAFDSTNWERSRRADHLLVLARWRSYDFDLRVLKPWARDPGFYVDRVQDAPFESTKFPLSGDALTKFKADLAAVPRLLTQARANLTEAAGEQTKYALRNLEKADGVGHGHPWRPVPPPGVVGWYDDLIEQTGKHHPDLVSDVKTARAAVVDFRDWLQQNTATFNKPSGIGLDNYDYLQKHIRLMPYDSRMNMELAQRELDRGRGFLALQRWRDRKLPALEPSPTSEEYDRRKKDADQQIRKFIVDEEILTIPSYIGELDTNVPWIVREGGKRNFWEEIQYRDPRPDHVHAVIPGHRFDGLVKRQDKRPIRGTYSDGGRSEGWGFYLEEMFLQMGLLDQRPRTKELFYLFQIKRAARNRAEVLMHANKYTIADAVKSMMDNVQFLDEDVARVDAEIYLRRPAYGSGYQMGKLQMDNLLSDRFHQLGDKFNLKEFHDQFLAAGTIPISVIRYEMTGFDDQVKHLFKRIPDPQPAPVTY